MDSQGVPKDRSSEQRRRELIEAARRQVEEAQGGWDPSTAMTSVSPIHGDAEASPLDQGSSAFALPPPDSFAGYKLLREIHRGAQGVVYQAIQESMKRKVAIKVMKEGPFAGSADRARFDREVKLLGQLSHPNIVTIHGTGQAAGCHFFVMDYISGQPLDVYMASEVRSVDDTLRLFGKICDAIASAHLRGIIHRDLKPSNIRVDTAGKPYVLDFGLAKSASDADASLMALTGRFLGTPAWASPEQAEGTPNNVDIRSDVYSLGVILYQMLTGRFPYKVTGSTQEVMDRIRKANPIRPRELHHRINDEVETIVLKCLSKEPERRYQSAGNLAQDVQRYLAGEPIEAKRDSLSYVFGKQLRRYKPQATIAASFLLLIIVGLVVTVFFWQQAKTAEQVAISDAERARVAARRAESMSDFMQRILSQGDALSRMGSQTPIRDVVDEAASQVESRLEDEPLVQADVKYVLGAVYRGWDLLDESESLLRDALEIRRQSLAPNDSEVAEVLRSLGITLQKKDGDIRTAEQMFRDALAIEVAHFGEDSVDTDITRQRLAILLSQTDRFDEALPLHRKSLEIRQAAFGADHIKTANPLISLGSLMRRMRRFDEAEAYFEQVRTIYGRTYAPDHARMAILHNNLALLFRDRGSPKEALPHLEKSLEIRVNRWDQDPSGKGHVSVAKAHLNLASVLDLINDFEQAEQHLWSALDIYNEALGVDSNDSARCMSRLAKLLQTIGQPDEAHDLAKQAVEIHQTPPLPPLLDQAASQQVYGEILLAGGDPQAAETHLRQARELLVDAGTPDQVKHAQANGALGACFVALDRLDEAEPMLLKSLRRLQATEGISQRHLVQALSRLTDLYGKLGKAEQVTRYRDMLQDLEAGN